MSEENKEEYNLEPLAEMVFIGEIVFQIKIAQRAAELLFDTTKAIDQLDYWNSIQSILTAAAKVSKILWPCNNNKKHIERKFRAERLRNLLTISEDNLISKRTIRDHLEHYDERIDEWFKDKKSAVYTDNVIELPKPKWADFPRNYHRSYNPVTKILTFRGDSINIGEVLEELDKIILKCQPYALI